MKINKIKFNVIDILIILVILAIVALGYVYINGKAVDSNSSDFTYDILFKEVTAEFVDAIQPGAAIFDGIKIIEIGNISDYSEKDAVRYEFSSQAGEYVETSIPGKYDVTMTVSAAGNCDELACFVNDYEVYIGKTVDVKSAGLVGHGVVVAINEVE